MATKKKTDLSAALTGLILGAVTLFLLMTAIDDDERALPRGSERGRPTRRSGGQELTLGRAGSMLLTGQLLPAYMPKAKPTEEKCAPKWRRCPEDRPEQILKAALEVFGERGLANARLQDIAERAGVSKGTIYLYFPNKEELFREMIRQTAVASLERAKKRSPKALRRTAARLHERLLAVRTVTGIQQIYRLVLAELHQFPDLATFYAHASRRGGSTSSAGSSAAESTGRLPRDRSSVAARMLSAIVVQHGIWRDQHTGVPLLAHGATMKFSASWPRSTCIPSRTPGVRSLKPMALPRMLSRSSPST